MKSRAFGGALNAMQQGVRQIIGGDLEAGVPYVGNQVCDLSNQHKERRTGSQLDHRVWKLDADYLTQGMYLSLRVRKE